MLDVLKYYYYNAWLDKITRESQTCDNYPTFNPPLWYKILIRFFLVLVFVFLFAVVVAPFVIAFILLSLR